MGQKKSWYAVKKGRVPGLYRTWPACREQVEHFPGAVYKGFAEKEAAEAFLQGTPPEVSPVREDPDPAQMTVYVDGSYAPFLPDRYAFGAVLLYGGKVETAKQCLIDPENAQMRNVAGEVAGARYVMETCLLRGISSVVIYYDYAGIENWCTGAWAANKPGTKALKAYYDSIHGKLSVRFRKVKSHTGVKYNEMADQLAKEALFGK